MKHAWRMLLVALLCGLVCVCAAAEEYSEDPVLAVSPIAASVPVKGGAVEIRPTEIDGETWLLLPAFAKLEEITFRQNGQALPVEHAGETEDGERILLVGETEVMVMQSQNLRALFFISDDPVNQGRSYIDNCEDHEHFTSASMALVDTEGHVDHAGKIRKLRGRGNGSWGGRDTSKNPYQFKLEERMDLLDTGIASEAERTWVVLAETSDDTHLHNRLCLDLGLELGLSETSHSEHIDLYYDGEYRGLYLLAEKSEIGTGRVDELDYDKLIQTWNDKVGQTDLDSLPVKEGTNRFGFPYTYIDGVVESQSPDAGAYMLEMESTITLSDRCYFRLFNDNIIACKNPENATQKMMDYISTRLQEARYTLEHNGVNPENGRTIEDDFDVDAFARTMIVQEWSYNYDGYRYSSSYFILPAGESRFRPGPLWDFDLAFRYYADGSNASGAGFKETGGWMGAFYQCDAFVEAIRDIYVNECYPILKNVLLGSEQGRYMQPLDAYAAEIDASRRMNVRLYGEKSGHLNRYLYGSGYEGEMQMLRQFIEQRTEWLYEVYRKDIYDDDTAVLWANAVYTHVDESVRVIEPQWNPAGVKSVQWHMISEATEEDYAVWQLELLLSPKEGRELKRISLNGVELPFEAAQDGLLRVCVTFEDPSYRPVDYYGEDIGLVYNPDVYAENYPEIAEMYEGDPQGLMDYFCDEGMYENHMGNAFFRPSEVLEAHAEMEYTLGEDWWTYYWDFIYYGQEHDKWLMYMCKRFWLDVQNAL